MGEGALSAAIVPIVTGYTHRGALREVTQLSNALLCAVAVILSLLTGVGMLASPWIVRAVVPGFWASPEKLLLTIDLTRLMFPVLLFVGLASVTMGVLNALGHFAVPVLGPVLFNLVMLGCALGISPLLHTPIYGLAGGVVLGAALIALRQPMVRILFQRGEFTRPAVDGTAVALLYYSLGLCAYAGLKIVVPAFYALQDTKTPVRIGVYAMLLNIVLSLLLLVPLQQGGLVLATSVSAYYQLGVLGICLRRRLGQLHGWSILRSAGKVGCASLVMAAGIAWLASSGLQASRLGTVPALILGGIVLGGLGGYLGLTLALGSEEARFLLRLVRERLAGG